MITNKSKQQLVAAEEALGVGPVEMARRLETSYTTYRDWKAKDRAPAVALLAARLLSEQNTDRAYAVVNWFACGGFEGVLFSDWDDAREALSGECESGPTLAVKWCETYGDASTELLELRVPKCK